MDCIKDSNMESKGWYNLFLRFVYWVLCPFVFISYCIEPFTDDIITYLGTAKVAALTPGFPMTLDSVWESRFIGHRFLYYVLNITDPFGGFWYPVWMKTVVGIVMIVILYYFSKRVAERWAIPFEYPFVVGFLGLFAINNFIIFSAEAHSVVIAMLMITLLLDNRWHVQTLASLLVLPLIIMKGLPVILVLTVMMAVMMLAKEDYIDRFKRAACNLFTSVPLALVVLAMYFPHFISDIVFAHQMAHIGLHSGYEVFSHFIWYGIGISGTAPIIMVGACAGFMVLSIVVRKHMRDVGLLAGMWLVGAVYVYYLAEFWYYHYYLMLIPAILTTCYFFKLYEYHREAFAVIVVATLILFCAVVAAWSPGMDFTQFKMMDERNRVLDSVLENTDMISQPTTLYLDSGSFAYLIPTRSACRYVGALPYQRDMPEWSMKNTPEYWEDRNCSLAYTGKYIVLASHWFDLNASTHQEMAQKLNTEYTRITNSTNDYSVGGITEWYWEIYQRKFEATVW